VLPGSHRTLPPVKPKIAAIRGKPTANSNKTKILLILGFNQVKELILVQMHGFFFNSQVLRCFPAKTVEIRNSAIFLLLWLKLIAAPLSRFRRF
jgi:hypothetical protein